MNIFPRFKCWAAFLREREGFSLRMFNVDDVKKPHNLTEHLLCAVLLLMNSIRF